MRGTMCCTVHLFLYWFPLNSSAPNCWVTSFSFILFPLHPIAAFCILPHFPSTRVSANDSNFLLPVTPPYISHSIYVKVVRWMVEGKQPRRLEIYPEEEPCDLTYILALHLYFSCTLMIYSFSRNSQKLLLKDLVFSLQFLRTLHQTPPNLDDSDILINQVLFFLFAIWLFSLFLFLQFLSGLL